MYHTRMKEKWLKGARWLRIDLQRALNSAYEPAAYERYIYEEIPEPALGPEDAAWAEQFRPVLLLDAFSRMARANAGNVSACTNLRSTLSGLKGNFRVNSKSTP